MAKKGSLIIKMMFMMIFMSVISFSDEAEKVIPKPEGIMAILTVIPLIIIIFMLYKKFDMLVAGLVGGVLAMIIGKISLESANGILLKSIPAMLTITVPIINSALAMAVFKSGGYTSALALVKRGIRGKVEYLAAFIVILQAAATYMSGIGGGSAMVIAPLAFAALGAIPELIAAMSIAAAVCFTTSPASLESSIVSKLSNTPVAEYVSLMKIFALVFTILAIALAFYGAKKRKVIFKEDEEDIYANKTNKQLFIMTIPTIFLLSAVIFGPFVNNLVGMPLISPLVYSIVTIILISVCTKLSLGESSNSMVEGSTYILVRLFSVGIFLTFINIIGETGAFAAIVSVAEIAPSSLVVPVAVLAGFLVGVPAGAYVGSILMLVIPIAVSLGFSPVELGFVAIGVGLGSQMSFVNITMQALSSGFRIPIIDVVKGNSRWILGSLGILLVVSYFV